MRIYVAGPYTSDPEGNVARAIDIADRLLEMGHTPFIPHLYHFWDQRHPHDYRTWMKMCLAWVEQCDALFYMEGHSPGREEEASLIRGLDRPVFHRIEDIPASPTRGEA